jgi:hypothetical protein
MLCCARQTASTTGWPTITMSPRTRPESMRMAMATSRKRIPTTPRRWRYRHLAVVAIRRTKSVASGHFLDPSIVIGLQPRSRIREDMLWSVPAPCRFSVGLHPVVAGRGRHGRWGREPGQGSARRGNAVGARRGGRHDPTVVRGGGNAADVSGARSCSCCAARRDPDVGGQRSFS